MENCPKLDSSYLLQTFKRAKARNGQTMTKAVVGPDSSPRIVGGYFCGKESRSFCNCVSNVERRVFTLSISQFSSWIAVRKALLTSGDPLNYQKKNKYQIRFNRIQL